MVYELERVMRVCDCFLCSKLATYDGAVQTSYFVSASYFDRKSEVILNVWLY